MSNHVETAKSIAADIAAALVAEAVENYGDDESITYNWTGKLELRDGDIWAEFNGVYEPFWATTSTGREGFMKHLLSAEWND